MKLLLGEGARSQGSGSASVVFSPGPLAHRAQTVPNAFSGAAVAGPRIRRLVDFVMR